MCGGHSVRPVEEAGADRHSTTDLGPGAARAEPPKESQKKVVRQA
jgi:hypothetical protein